ncbi:MAG: fibrillarin-like rRNA/tRNA 2'-O-methyltransferase [Candidatus Aenigmatarchaeota archaeon]
MIEKFQGVFLIDKKPATLNLVPGKAVYGEKLTKIDGREYREWVPNRSKPAAAIMKNLKNFPVKKGCKILYLGIAQGTTSSHFSDIVGSDGAIYGVEISERAIRELLSVAEERKNIIPILGDARKPETYENMITDKIDVVYEDVADSEQCEILIRNSKRFLKQGGFAMIAIKSRCIDVTKKPERVFEEAKKKLAEYFEIVEAVRLEPYEMDHEFVVAKVKK